MQIDEQLYNEVLCKALEFGPEYAKPLKEKASEILKNLPMEEQIKLTDYIEKTKFDIIDHFYDEYEKAHNDPEYKIIDFKEYIEKNYPWIDCNNTQELISHAGYLAYSEGLITDIKLSIKDKLKIFCYVTIIILISIIIVFAGSILNFFIGK